MSLPYLYKTPAWLRWIYPQRIWRLPASDNQVYLSFDDGPHPFVTPWVLDILKEFDAKASFFCIGKNVEQYPGIYKRILDEGHSAGNHTHTHKNGWHTPLDTYIEDVKKSALVISSRLFRPPYGRLRSAQAKAVKKVLGTETKIIMWDLLSGDFDPAVNISRSVEQLNKHTKPGSILVFHDSEKAFPQMQQILPAVMKNIKLKGWGFGGIN